jgi:hypothetical protein
MYLVVALSRRTAREMFLPAARGEALDMIAAELFGLQRRRRCRLFGLLDESDASLRRRCSAQFRALRPGRPL